MRDNLWIYFTAVGSVLLLCWAVIYSQAQVNYETRVPYHRIRDVLISLFAVGTVFVVGGLACLIWA